jgi:SprB-like repeat protein
LEPQINSTDDLIRLLQYLREHRKEFSMAQVQLSVTFNVVPPTPPALTVTPAVQTENLTVGVAADGTAVATVSGGVPPYTYALDANSGALPTGVTFAESSVGVITLAGTPTTAGTSTSPVLLDIVDSAGTSAQLKVIASVKPVL